jgi:protein subunit release factor B
MSWTPVEIPESLLEVSTSRASGPGGQHVNKTESKVEIRFNLNTATWIPYEVRVRLTQLYPAKVTKDGDFVLTDSTTRSQHRNYENCLNKLRELLTHAGQIPKNRVSTRPTRSSKKKRLQTKSNRGEVKRNRKKPSSSWD